MRRIVFWQPIDSPHQAAFLEAVARRFSGEVILGVERLAAPERSAQGWRRPRHEHVRVVDISDPANLAALAAHTTGSLHVFSGFFSHPLVWRGFRLLCGSPAPLAIFSEAPEQPPTTGWLKRQRGRLLARRWAERFAFALVIGTVGREFFTRIGWPRERIVPFAYAVDAPPPPSRGADAAAGSFRLVSAGQLIRRKGVDLLVEACRGLPATGWRLDIHGDGPERPRLERLVARRRLGERVAFLGTTPGERLAGALAAADCAVLPSRFDGWGMLVSESLAAGTPVICTDRCGAALLAERGAWPADGPPRPLTVVRPTAAALAEALAAAVAAGPPPPSVRETARAGLAPFTPAAAAAAFLDLVPPCP